MEAQSIERRCAHDVTSDNIIMPCRSMTAGELGVRPGLGASQEIWYMEQLNQFVAPMLLPAQPTAAIATNRHLQHDTKETADAVLTNVKTAVVSLQQQAQAGQPAAHKLHNDLIAASLSVGRQSQRVLLQEATYSSTQNTVTDQAAAAPAATVADEVGEIYMYTADDMRAIASLWWNYTIQMRVFHETHAQVCWQTPAAAVHLYLLSLFIALLKLPDFFKLDSVSIASTSVHPRMACYRVHNNHTLPSGMLETMFCVQYSVQHCMKRAALHPTPSISQTLPSLTAQILPKTGPDTRIS